MHFSVVQRILGILLMVFSLSMLPPVLVSLWYQDGAATSFLFGFLVIGVALRRGVPLPSC